MRFKKLQTIFFVAAQLAIVTVYAQKKSRPGIVKQEFIFEQADFPESHAATIAETPAGLIAAWFGGTNEGNRDACIWTSRLINNKWTPPAKVADGVINDSLRFACYNPVLYQVPKGDLLLFYKVGPNVVGWTGWMVRSNNNGASWGSPEALPHGFLGPIKNKPVLINGLLVCPSSTENTGWKIHFEYTADEGRTWKKSEDLNDGITISGIQPALCIHKDGSLQALCRSQNGTINECFSNDGGIIWSKMTKTDLPNNNSGIDAVTLKDGRHLLVYNHVAPDNHSPDGRGPRTPLNVALSSDGKHWYAAAVLEDASTGEYSYPSVIQSKNGMVHIVYTWRRQCIKYVQLDPSKLNARPILNGRWPSKDKSFNQQ